MEVMTYMVKYLQLSKFRVMGKDKIVNIHNPHPRHVACIPELAATMGSLLCSQSSSSSSSSSVPSSSSSSSSWSFCGPSTCSMHLDLFLGRSLGREGPARGREGPAEGREGPAVVERVQPRVER